MTISMQLAGTTSWKMGTDEPQSLLMALYVRDAAGLRPRIDPDLPPLEPAVPFDHEQLPMAGIASDQWADWWRQLLDGGGFWPDHKSPTNMSRLRHDPELQRIFYWPSRYLPPDFVGLSGAPELQSLVRRHFEAARVWSEARKHEFVALTVARQRVSLEWEVVQSIERGLGRKACPFALDIRVLPVEAVQAWRLSPNRALVSRALFRDRATYREWLRPIIEELA
jgi:hypothetical protein